MDDKTRGMKPGGGEDETEFRTRGIREEIAQTRVEMSETIEAIQERLSPSHLVAQAGETVRNATTQKVKQMATTAGQAADQVMDTSFVRTVRANPIPVAMVGIGAAWLLLKGRSDDGRGYGTRHESRYRTRNGSDVAPRDWRVAPDSGVAVGTTGRGNDGDDLREASSRDFEFGGGHSGYAGAGRESVSVDRVVRENPLVVGAAAALVGVAVGMSLPASGTENRLMGEARDTVVDRARELASDATGKVQEVAEQVLDSATPPPAAAGQSSQQPGAVPSLQPTSLNENSQQARHRSQRKKPNGN
jgi:hypothetical protein